MAAFTRSSRRLHKVRGRTRRKQAGFILVGAMRSLLGRRDSGGEPPFSINDLFASGEPGFHLETYDPAALLERRNIVTYTEDLTHANWTKANCTVAGGFTDPDGGTKAFRVTATNNSASVYNPRVGVSLQRGITSVYARRVSGTGVVYVQAPNGQTNTALTLTSEWQRFSSAVTSDLSGTTYAGSVFIATSGDVIEVAFPQTEPGTAATAYQAVTDWFAEYLAAAGAANIDMWEDSYGVTPVVAVERPVGLWRDIRLGRTLGPELNDGTWTLSAGASENAGVITLTTSSATDVTASNSFATESEKTYLLTFRKVSAAGTSTSLFITAGQTAGATQSYGAFWGDVGPRTYTIQFKATSATTVLRFANVDDTAATSVVDSISIKEVPGNHHTQATGNSRFVLSALFNKLLKTDQFNDAAWSKGDTTVVANAAVAPDGSATADKLEEAATTGLHYALQSFTAVGGAAYVLTWRVKAAERTKAWIYAENESTGAIAYFDLAAGTAGTLGGAATGKASSITALGDGWYELKLQWNATGSGSKPVGVGTATADGTSSTVGVAGSGIYVWGADLRTAADAALDQPAYQRVNTATDYDTEGFAHYPYFDGVDDHAVAVSGGGGSTGFLFCAAVTPTGGAGLSRVLWSDLNGNAGYRVMIDTANQVQIAAGNGAALTTVATVATLTVGETHIVTAWDDGINLCVQIDNGAVATIARPVVSPGTAAMTIGRSNGASSGYYTGRMSPATYRQSDCGDAQRAQLKQYHAGLAKFTLT